MYTDRPKKPPLIQKPIYSDNKCLVDFLTSLSNKPKLQYIILRLKYLPLRTLSDGLKNLIGSDQIKLFELKSLSDLFCFVRDANSPFEGLCEFLLRNKNTLSELSLDTPLFKEQVMNEPLSNTISQLSELRSLAWKVSTGSLVTSGRSEFPVNLRKNNWFENSCLNISSTDMNPKIEDILPKLEKLQDLTLQFHLFGAKPYFYERSEDNCTDPEWTHWDYSKNWVFGACNLLPLLTNLRSFKFQLPQEASTISLENRKVVLRRAANLKSALIKATNIQFVSKTNDYEDENIKKVIHEKALKVNLSF